MAKLGAYYGLCPLIDQRNLLGICEDLEVNNVIVTLGKNIAIKYRLSDQKQIHSWRTKDKFTSPIIYDRESEHYVAVFNQIYIRMWRGDEEYLDKLKKNKFCNSIHTLVASGNKSFVVFKSGNVIPLNIAVRDRKQQNLGGPNDSFENILDVLSATSENKTLIGLLQDVKDKLCFTWYIFENDEQQTRKINLVQDNPDLRLVGQVLCPLEHENRICLLTLWSNGKLFSYPLESENDFDSLIKVDPPGNLFAIVETLSCKQLVTMVSLNHHYVAMYGAMANEEGAILILYNTQFKVFQSRQTLKLFTCGAKLWKIESNLLFCVGQNLAVIPFYLTTEQLAALVGSHRDILNDLDPDVTVVEELQCVRWDGVTIQSDVEPIPNEIKATVTELAKQGMSEAIMCEELLSNYLESNNIQGIQSCLEYFTDISEMYLAKLLKFCITVNSKFFKETQKHSSDDFSVSLQPPERRMLLDKILTRSFSDVLLLPYIQLELDLNCAAIMLEYICYLMSENDHSLITSNITESELKLIEWCCLLLDANYQKLLLSKDSNILTILVRCNNLVKNYLDCLDNLRQITPLLIEIKRRKIFNKNKQIGNLKYSIEQLKLY